MRSSYRALLIEDSKPVSFYNKVMLEKSNKFSEIEISENGRDALKFLNDGFSPDIIFLDLNMPVMNGWEFLEEYVKTSSKLSPIILLLGTQLPQSDQDKLTNHSIVRGIRTKMLSKNVILEIENNILKTPN